MLSSAKPARTARADRRFRDREHPRARPTSLASAHARLGRTRHRLFHACGRARRARRRRVVRAVRLLGGDGGPRLHARWRRDRSRGHERRASPLPGRHAVLRTRCDRGREHPSTPLARRRTALRHAILLDPQNADAHHWLSLTLIIGFGAREEAIREQAIAARLNPVSPVLSGALSWQQYLRGEYRSSRSSMEPVLDLNAELEEGHAGLVRMAARWATRRR